MEDFREGKRGLSPKEAMALKKRIANPKRARINDAVKTKSRHSVVRNRTAKLIKRSYIRTGKFKENKKLLSGLILLIAIAGSVAIWSINRQPDISTDQLGVQNEGQAGEVSGLPVIENDNELPFDLLYPAGKQMNDYQIVRISPEANEPVYAYVDSIEGAPLRVSQQSIPDKINNNLGAELESLAKDFQATSIIQIDENKIYHGYNEKQKVQSLIFIKNNNLIFISSSKKHSDDIWAGFINGLQ